MKKKVFIRAVSLLTCMILTAHAGRITNIEGRQETYYNLKMNKVVNKADNFFNLNNMYWEREDGCKMYGNYVIVATDWKLHPYGTLINTSRGLGIVLDTGSFNGEIIDIATTW